MDFSSIIGLLLGFGAILLGFVLEKGNILSLALLSPAIIVFGGTLGAVFLSFSIKEIKKIPKIVLSVFSGQKMMLPELIEQMVTMSTSSRKQGLLTLESYLEDPKINPFMKRGIELIVDSTDEKVLREILETDIHLMTQKRKIEISMFEAAGGYSPTLGIIGTIMGLVQVLSNMSSPEELSASIAVAFIATLYGVCFANLLYLPIASKLKLNLKYQTLERDMIVEAMCSINMGESPAALRARLNGYLDQDVLKKAKKKQGAAEAKVENVEEK